MRESSLPILGVLKAAGALGLLIGFRVRLIGIASAVGLTLFLAVLYRCGHYPSPSARLLLGKRSTSHIPSGRPSPHYSHI